MYTNQIDFQALRQTVFSFQTQPDKTANNEANASTGHPTTWTITTGTSSVTCG